MTYEEVNDYWNNQKPVRNGKTIWLMISAAIKKQIPMKPVYIKEHNVIYFDWQCPNCKREYINSVHGIKSCVDCGQAIDWSEEK